jgi:hypothetical protein
MSRYFFRITVLLSFLFFIFSTGCSNEAKNGTKELVLQDIDVETKTTNESAEALKEEIFNEDNFEIDYTIEPFNISGAIIDGYIYGANVFADLSGNGAKTSGEYETFSLSDGKYILENVRIPLNGIIYAKSGQDSITGNNFDGQLSTIVLKNSENINNLHITPISTLITYMIKKADFSFEEAQNLILSSFELDNYDLLHTDPLSLEKDEVNLYLVNQLIYKRISLLNLILEQFKLSELDTVLKAIFDDIKDEKNSLADVFIAQIESDSNLTLTTNIEQQVTDLINNQENELNENAQTLISILENIEDSNKSINELIEESDLVKAGFITVQGDENYDEIQHDLDELMADIRILEKVTFENSIKSEIAGFQNNESVANLSHAKIFVSEFRDIVGSVLDVDVTTFLENGLKFEEMAENNNILNQEFLKYQNTIEPKIETILKNTIDSSKFTTEQFSMFSDEAQDILNKPIFDAILRAFDIGRTLYLNYDKNKNFQSYSIKTEHFDDLVRVSVKPADKTASVFISGRDETSLKGTIFLKDDSFSLIPESMDLEGFIQHGNSDELDELGNYQIVVDKFHVNLTGGFVEFDGNATVGNDIEVFQLQQIQVKQKFSKVIHGDQEYLDKIENLNSFYANYFFDTNIYLRGNIFTENYIFDGRLNFNFDNDDKSYASMQGSLKENTLFGLYKLNGFIEAEIDSFDLGNFFSEQLGSEIADIEVSDLQDFDLEYKKLSFDFDKNSINFAGGIFFPENNFSATISVSNQCQNLNNKTNCEFIIRDGIIKHNENKIGFKKSVLEAEFTSSEVNNIEKLEEIFSKFDENSQIEIKEIGEISGFKSFNLDDFRLYVSGETAGITNSLLAKGNFETYRDDNLTYTYLNGAYSIGSLYFAGYFESNLKLVDNKLIGYLMSKGKFESNNFRPLNLNFFNENYLDDSSNHNSKIYILAEREPISPNPAYKVGVFGSADTDKNIYNIYDSNNIRTNIDLNTIDEVFNGEKSQYIVNIDGDQLASFGKRNGNNWEVIYSDNTSESLF